jgi:hypothetical protein
MEVIAERLQAKLDAADALLTAVSRGLRGDVKVGPSPKKGAEPAASSSSSSSTLRELFAKSETGLPAEIAQLRVEHDARVANYSLSTAMVLFEASQGEHARARAGEKFANIVSRLGVAADTDAFVRRLERVLLDYGVKVRATASATTSHRKPRGEAKTQLAAPKAAPPMSAAALVEIQRLLDSYPHDAPLGPNARHSTPVSAKAAKDVNELAALVPAVDPEGCACGARMGVDCDRSELKCDCGRVSTLDGIVFDDMQFYSQEGQKAKSGSFNPNRHFQFWWKHIHGHEPPEEIGDPHDPDNLYGEKLVAQLRAKAKAKGLLLQLLTVTDVREMLREVGRPELNKNVALLLRQMTGIGPPTPSDELAHRVERWFSKAIEIGEAVQREDRVNRDYYPFYIHRILDSTAILPEGDHEARRVLYYIYLQGDDTLKKDDRDWEQICAHPDMRGITYEPTSRAKALKYHRP